MIKRKLKVFVCPRQTARRIRSVIIEQMNQNCSEISDTRTEIERHNVHQPDEHCEIQSGINVQENIDCEIVDHDVTIYHADDESTDDESADESDLSEISDFFYFDYKGSNCNATDFDVESVGYGGQEKDLFDWDYFEENDNLSENKERQELFFSARR